MIILEGTDAVGKTTTIESLKNEFTIQDRDRYISKLMDFDISTKERSKLYYEYLKNTNNIVIFLVNNDKSELERRVYKRNVIDEYDKMTYIYNLLYLETYYYMQYNDLLNHQLYLVDTTNLNIEEQTNEVRKVLKKVCQA